MHLQQQIEIEKEKESEFVKIATLEGEHTTELLQKLVHI